ncbi:Ulp1-like peptidase [Cucumis melo var. makuwa]|uniref:Ulp1-like peptidase n=1 Tax=Cucumis melo var. makuwa TaxID=1194695 RepID=A0A5A7TG64_CUCMM|nr:Ulp1-like peptidase [Cucumis melo var. makuwa]TYK05371.1 Ulp1-like peptidase [Cucumis melo var. makuwa]
MVVPSDKYFPVTISYQVHKIGIDPSFLAEADIPEDGNTDGLCFSVLGKNVRFTQKEFNIITGLWPTNTTLEKDCDNKRLQSLLFRSENKKLITCLEIEKIFKNFEFTNDDDAVKVALAVFIETVMVGKDKKIQFDMNILERVDDEEAFKSFDWSTFFYTRLLNSLKTSLQGKKEAYELKKTTSSKAVAYYNIKGHVLAFQDIEMELYTSSILQNAVEEHIRQQKFVKPKLKLSTQEKAFMESRIRRDDNMQMEDDESIRDINNNDTSTPDHVMNNKSLEQLDSSPQLSPQKEQSQTVADQSEMHPPTRNVADQRSPMTKNNKVIQNPTRN